MSTTKPLTDNQLLILTNAAQRLDHMVLPLPSTVPLRGGAQRATLSALVKRNLVQEIAVGDSAAGWRTDPEGQLFGLRLTAAGLAAAGAPAAAEPIIAEPTEAALANAEPALPSPAVKPQGPERGEPGSAAAEAENATQPSHPKGKLGAILQAISAESGATLDEITAQTGWLPHTARAAVTGLRKRGFGVQLITQGQRKAYRLTDAC